jgi:transposase
MPESNKRGSKDTQESIRIKAVKMRLKGVKPKIVSETFDITVQALSKMMKRYEEGGFKALKNNKRGKGKDVGRRLTDDQEYEIYRSLIDHCPDQLKFPFALWTREAIRQLILHKYDIDIPLRTLSDYLKRWDMTPQKPQKRAYERCDKRVDKWHKEEYPKIEKRAQKEKAEIHWADETNCQSIPNNLRGFSEKGVTPVLKHPAKKFKVNMISSVTKLGKMRFMFFEENFDCKVFIEFLRRLIKDSKKKIFVIVDNLRVHHSKKVAAWIAQRPDKIEIFYLPPYSPDLNPDEYLNNDLKQNANRNDIPKDLDSLKKNTNSYMRSLQKRPDKIKGFFRHRKTAYAA